MKAQQFVDSVRDEIETAHRATLTGAGTMRARELFVLGASVENAARRIVNESVSHAIINALLDGAPTTKH